MKYREKKENNTTTGGIGFVGLLQIAFIVLKLCKVINWNWLLVLLPIIISTSIFLIFIVVILIIIAIRKQKKDAK